jgi:mannosyltransferase OCH1-like enzyme
MNIKKNKKTIEYIFLFSIILLLLYIYTKHDFFFNFTNKLNNYTTTIPHYIPKRTHIPLQNKTMLIKTSVYDKSDYHHVVYYINPSTVFFIIRRLDNDTIDYNLYLNIHNNDNNTYERIFIHKDDTKNKNYYTATYTITSSLKLSQIYLNYEQKIPKKIIQTSETSICTLAQYNALQTFLELNPEYEYYHYTNNDRLSYLKQHYDTIIVQAYNKVIPGAYKADLFRACIINKEGGCYFDNKQINKEPLRTFINKNDDIVLCNDAIKNAIYNAIYISIPNTDLTSSYVDNILYNIQTNYYGTCGLCPTGPCLLKKTFDHSTYKNKYIRLYHKKYMFTTSNQNSIIDNLTLKKIIYTHYMGYYNNKRQNYDAMWYNKNIYKYYN